MAGRGLDNDQIFAIFSFHPPKDASVASRHEAVRDACKEAALTIKEMTPDSPEQTTAIRKLQEAMMHANAAIAIHS